MFENKKCVIYGKDVTFNINIESKEDISNFGYLRIVIDKYLEVKVEGVIDYDGKKISEFVIYEAEKYEDLSLQKINSLINKCSNKVKKRIDLLNEEKEIFKMWNSINIETLL